MPVYIKFNYSLFSTIGSISIPSISFVYRATADFLSEFNSGYYAYTQFFHIWSQNLLKVGSKTKVQTINSNFMALKFRHSADTKCNFMALKFGTLAEIIILLIEECVHILHS
jgi:hypothetical protein